MLGPQTLGTMHRAMMGMTDGATMPRHMMKIMFAIMDADGDNTLSFEEVMAIPQSPRIVLCVPPIFLRKII